MGQMVAVVHPRGRAKVGGDLKGTAMIATLDFGQDVQGSFRWWSSNYLSSRTRKSHILGTCTYFLKSAYSQVAATLSTYPTPG